MATVSPRRVRSLHPSHRPPCSPITVPPKWDQIPVSSPQPQKRSAGTALAGTHFAISAEARAGRGPFPEPTPTYRPTHGTFLAYPNNLGTATATVQAVISCIIDTVSQCFRGPQAQHAGPPPRLSQRLVDGVMRSTYKKPVITCHMSRSSSLRTQVTRTSPSCSTGTHSSRQGLVVHGSPCCSRTRTTPFPFRHSHGHVLLCSP